MLLKPRPPSSPAARRAVLPYFQRAKYPACLKQCILSMATCILEREADLPVPPRERSAFNFENVTRNSRFETTSGFCAPKAMKTGTTICGVVFKGGVVLGADTRATEGTIVADKNCEKIHYIAPNIYCCGAGTSADTENVTSMVASTLALQRLTMGKQSRVLAAQTVLKRHLFRCLLHF